MGSYRRIARAMNFSLDAFKRSQVLELHFTEAQEEEEKKKQLEAHTVTDRGASSASRTPAWLF